MATRKTRTTKEDELNAHPRAPGDHTKCRHRPLAAEEWRQCPRERRATTAELRLPLAIAYGVRQGLHVHLQRPSSGAGTGDVTGGEGHEQRAGDASGCLQPGRKRGGSGGLISSIGGRAASPRRSPQKPNLPENRGRLGGTGSAAPCAFSCICWPGHSASHAPRGPRLARSPEFGFAPRAHRTGISTPPPARWYSSAVSAISDERPVAAPAEDLDSNGNDVRLHRSAVSQRLEQRARPRDDVETNIEPAVRQLGDELRVRQETPEDENGVDRTQIRWMLSQSPEQRLGHIETLVAEILEIWERNGTHPVR